MAARLKLKYKMLSMLLCIALIMNYLPLLSLRTKAAVRDSISITSDESTMNDWQKFFPMGNNIHTENAGGIWTDKSVFTDDSAFSDITMNETNSFLVALSAMGSNMTVTGMSSVPTDTMLVLDVSGSMEGSASSLVSAANNTIKTLLEANKYNRVGVILYSGPRYQGSSNGQGDAVVTLPLGTYTTNDSQGRFLNLSSGEISLDTEVVITGTATRPASSSKEVVGGTYIQSGVNLAKNQFTATTNQTTVSDANMGTVKRKPIMVIMSDGAPTLASTSFTSPTNSNIGDGTSSNASIGFTTQLTISYAKQQIEEKYNNDALVYTLGVGLTSSTNGYRIARSVLNPSGNYTDSSANSMKTFWQRYQDATVGSTVSLSNNRRVTKIQETLSSAYVTRYFAASSSNDMITAFQQIADDISLQSKYFPTLTKENENLSGYVTFVDKIGKYMEVTKVEGIRLHQTLFSGVDLASNFVSDGGLLGTYNNPSTLGNELVNAVMQRIGTPDLDTARTLIGLAYEYGQLSYNASTGDFSNYIGWFADKDGKFLGFWHEGIDKADIPADAVYVMKSYGYLGETDATHGVEKSDMMYATVQLREDIATGEQQITFAVPAALIPTVTYEVSLDESGNPTELTQTGATAPIRLVYKVALREDINEFNVTELVDSAYIAQNTNPDGSINFYTNQYEVDNSTGFNTVTGQPKVNTYSYFRPSRQNDRYYYQSSSLVYTDDQGTVYHGTAQPTNDTGDMYHSYTVYRGNGTQYTKETTYHKLTDETLSTTEQTPGEDTWFIPEGDVRRDYAGYVDSKSPNKTGTLTFAVAPFTDIHGHSVNDTGHYFVVGATLGNNGKLTLNRETGIKITKALAAGIADTGASFEFMLTNTTNSLDNTTYPAYKVLADGTSQDTTVKFVNGVAANIFLKAGEALYIGGMTAGNTIKVEEVETDKYTVQSVNGNNGSSVNIAVVEYNITAANFINTERGTGNLTISKNIVHPFGTNYEIPSTVNSFDITVTLTLNGNPLANRTYGTTNNGTVPTGANGEINFSLSDGEQFEIYGLPEGTVATVVESSITAGFTPEYWDNGTSGDGIVDIEADRTSSVIVVNNYEPNEVFPVNIKLSGTKTLTGRTPDAWIDADKYSFVLEQYNFTTGNWEMLGSPIEVNKDTPDYKFDFSNIFADTNFRYEQAGTYYYRVREESGNVAGVTYDVTLHSFSVLVTDENMDGQLEIKSVEASRPTTDIQFESGTYTITTNFTNVYNADETDAAISISKKVTNESESPLATLDGFEFEVYEYNILTSQVGNKLTTSLPTSLTGTTRVIMHYDTAGTYYYAVKEAPGQRKGFTYSEETILITVVVSDDGNGNLIAKAYKNTEGQTGATSTVNIEFTNVYEATQATLDLDFVNKTLNGRTLNAGEFNFTLTPAQGSSLIDRDGNAITQITGTNDASGNVNFTQPLYFNKVGTYFYNIQEDAGTLGGVAYDKNTYRIVVTVSDNDATLSASYIIVNTQETEITFVNTYTVKPIGNSITGTKELTGRILLNDEFTFILTEATDALGTVQTGAKVYTAKNTLSTRSTQIGTFTFPEITYDKAGTYYYTVTEQGSAGSATYGVTYDTTKYVVTVIINDNGAGELEVGSVTYGTGITELKFNNTYKAEKTYAVIPGNKILEGRVLGNEEFSFKLFKSDALWGEGEELETVTNTANGDFEFEQIQFEEAGTFYYLVKEVKGNKGGVTYDETVFRIRVEITDDLLGQLHSSVYVFDNNDIPQAEVEFVNTYTISGNANVKLEGTKTLEGKTLTNNEFTFELFETDDTFTVSGNADKTTGNTGKNIEFNLDYTVSDVGNTYYYVVREKNAGQTINGITYSNAVYKITVVVEDNGLGGIKTTTTIFNGTTNVETIDFKNTFSASKAVELAVAKTVENKGSESITPENFDFKVDINNGADIRNIKTNAEGKASTTLNLTEKDVGKQITVKITEVAGNRANVKYSTKEYNYVITVSLDANNNIVTAITENTVSVDKVSAAFVNEYDYTPPSPPQTGDTFNPMLWFTLLFVSVCGLAGTALYMANDKKKAE